MNERTNERTNEQTRHAIQREQALALGGGGERNQTGVSPSRDILFIDPAFTALPRFHFPQVTVPPRWASFIVRPVFCPGPAERQEP